MPWSHIVGRRVKWIKRPPNEHPVMWLCHVTSPHHCFILLWSISWLFDRKVLFIKCVVWICKKVKIVIVTGIAVHSVTRTPNAQCQIWEVFWLVWDGGGEAMIHIDANYFVHISLWSFIFNYQIGSCILYRFTQVCQSDLYPLLKTNV